ncbi:MAG: sugar-transfer associated ATP-grasp domain-containing protein [Dongiaceae bacterium]
MTQAGQHANTAAATISDRSPDQPTTRLVRHEPLGVRTRRLQREILSADRSLEGRWWLFFHRVVKPLHNLLRIAGQIKLVGARVKREFGVPIHRQIFDQCRLVLATGATPWVYYICELYCDGAMKHAGEVVTRNTTKHGLWKALNRIDPEAKNRGRQLGDKVAVSAWCEEAGIPHPHPIIRVEQGEIIWQGRSRSDLDRDLFIKRRDSRGANGAGSFRRVAPFQYRDDDGALITLDELLPELQRRSYHRSQMVLPLLHNHPTLADFAQDSLLAFRILTCLDEQLRPELTNVYMRSIAKLEPRWDVGRIEDFAAVMDLKTGRLGQLTGDKPECLSEWFDRHPVTGALVTGRVVPFWQELIQLALKAHAMVPERVVVGWDFAITEEGPVMLEGNTFPDTVYPQRMFQKPFGLMRIGQLMSFHLDRMEAKLAQSPGFFLTK